MSGQRGNVFFRTDASIDIGNGHVMRCLALADGMREHGFVCHFICRDGPGNLIGLLIERGFKTFALPFSAPDRGSELFWNTSSMLYANWLDADWSTDVEQTTDVLSQEDVDWLVVDHYALDSRWELALRRYCRHLMVIDDLADRPHDCDVLLDQNLGRSLEHYGKFVSPECEMLLGPSYALLRPGFSALRDYSLKRRASLDVEHLLISLGGVDKNNVTHRVLEILKGCRLRSGCRLSVVMGKNAPWISEISHIAHQMPWATEVLINVNDMASLMAMSDLAIGAAGTSAWERCCLGLPTLTLVLADNQYLSANALEAAGAIKVLNDIEGDGGELNEQLSLLSRPKHLQAMQSACASITDGYGVPRVVSKLVHING